MTSGTAKTVSMPAKASRLDATSVKTLRLAIGVTIAAALAYGFAWPMAFIATVFTWNFLRMPAAIFTPKVALVFLCAMAIGIGFGYLVGVTILRYHLLFMISMFLLMFLVFYSNRDPISGFTATFMTIGLTVIPLSMLSSVELGLIITVYLVLGGAVAILLTLFMFGLLPDPPLQAPLPQSPPPSKPAVHPTVHLYNSLINTCIVYPVIVVFYTFNLTDSLVTLVLIAIMAQQTDVAAGSGKAMETLWGNLFGGLAAMVFYYLLLSTPTYGFLILLFLSSALVFARLGFSDSKNAALYASVYGTVLVLIGLGTSSSGAGVPAKFVVRIIQVMMMVVYVITAFQLVEPFRPKPHSNEST
jgi:hypothetical protein